MPAGNDKTCLNVRRDSFAFQEIPSLRMRDLTRRYTPTPTHPSPQKKEKNWTGNDFETLDAKVLFFRLGAKSVV